ncbi:13294_t:CDS:2, partial [Acaulospora colombiana]
MSELTYNVTIPHTSIHIEYSKEGWVSDCPKGEGRVLCSDSSGTVGSHIAYNVSRQFGFNFYGKLYYYSAGAMTNTQLDPGVKASISFNYKPAIPLSPGNGFLAAYDDFTTACDTFDQGCTDRSALTNRSNPFNTFVINITDNTSGGALRFTKASISIRTYSIDDGDIVYSDGWSRNGTYMQSGIQTRQYSRPASSFKLVFDGPAVWIWGFCGRREQQDNAHYGRLYVNNDGGEGQVANPNNTLTDARPEDAKCLIYFIGNLDDRSNQIVFKDSQTCNFQLHSIDVLQVTKWG